eukprot:Nk52_evm20s96 gene=Nk52_evmTU20s96
METEAADVASKQIRQLFQRPEQIDKIDQHRRRFERKKAAVDGRLKATVQAQLDDINTGLRLLKNSQTDIDHVRNNLGVMDGLCITCQEAIKDYKQVQWVGKTRKNIHYTRAYMDKIFSVGETVNLLEKAMESDDCNLLTVQHKLAELEECRDELLDFAKAMPEQRKALEIYFKDVDHLAKEMTQRLWTVLSQVMHIGEARPELLVTVLRIIEREERRDKQFVDAEAVGVAKGLGRPRNFRKMCFDTLRASMVLRFESQFSEESIEQRLRNASYFIINDLLFVHNTLAQRFPPSYDIFDFFLQNYYSILYETLDKMAASVVKPNAIVLLLNWVETFLDDMFEHLEIERSELNPPLLETRRYELMNRYVSLIKMQMSEWSANILVNEESEWLKSTAENSPLEVGADDFFYSSAPIILFQMVDQQFAVASSIRNNKFVFEVLQQCGAMLLKYQSGLEKQIQTFSQEYFRAETKPEFFMYYLMCNINNNVRCREFTDQLKTKCDGLVEGAYRTLTADSFKEIMSGFSRVSNVAAKTLLALVFDDVTKLFGQMFTKQWAKGMVSPLDTILVTLDDYSKDFIGHISEESLRACFQEMHRSLLVEYFRALMEGRTYIVPKVYMDKMQHEQEQIEEFFNKLFTGRLADPAFAEEIFIKTQLLKEVRDLISCDEEYISLYACAIRQKCPDFSFQHAEAISSSDSPSSSMTNLKSDPLLRAKRRRSRLLQKLHLQEMDARPQGAKGSFDNVKTEGAALAQLSITNGDAPALLSGPAGAHVSSKREDSIEERRKSKVLKQRRVSFMHDFRDMLEERERQSIGGGESIVSMDSSNSLAGSGGINLFEPKEGDIEPAGNFLKLVNETRQRKNVLTPLTEEAPGGDSSAANNEPQGLPEHWLPTRKATIKEMMEAVVDQKGSLVHRGNHALAKVIQHDEHGNSEAILNSIVQEVNEKSRERTKAMTNEDKQARRQSLLDISKQPVAIASTKGIKKAKTSDDLDKIEPEEQQKAASENPKNESVETSLNLHQLKELMVVFETADSDGSGALDIDEFIEAFREVLGSGSNYEEQTEMMTQLFMKIDSNSDGSVDWDEFCTYMLLEYQRVHDAEASNAYKVYQNLHLNVRVPHRDPICQIFHYPKESKYISLSRGGSLCFWTNEFNLDRTLELDRRMYGKWFNHMLILNKHEKIALSVGNKRELVFLDARNHDPQLILKNLPSVPTYMDEYYFEEFNHVLGYTMKDTFVLYGDDSGHINCLIFPSTNEIFSGRRSSIDHEPTYLDFDNLICSIPEPDHSVRQRELNRVKYKLIYNRNLKANNLMNEVNQNGGREEGIPSLSGKALEEGSSGNDSKEKRLATVSKSKNPQSGFMLQRKKDRKKDKREALASSKGSNGEEEDEDKNEGRNDEEERNEVGEEESEEPSEDRKNDTEKNNNAQTEHSVKTLEGKEQDPSKPSSPCGSSSANINGNLSQNRVGSVLWQNAQKGLKKQAKVSSRKSNNNFNAGRLEGGKSGAGRPGKPQNKKVCIIRCKVANEWVGQVKYFPGFGFILCSEDERASLVTGTITKSSIQIRNVFKVTKGVFCFDYNKERNVIVTGGMDRLVRLWNPYVTAKPTSILDGHTGPVMDVRVQEGEGLIYSYGKDNTVRLWDLKDLIPMQVVCEKIAEDNIFIGAFTLNVEERKLIIGGHSISAWAIEKKDSHVEDVHSHFFPLTAALYNPNFKQIVTGCAGSTIRVWDSKSGSLIFQFKEVFGKEEITAMKFDWSGRRLLTGSRAGELSVWNHNNGNCLNKLIKDTDEEVSTICSASAHGMKIIFSAGWDRELKQYSDSNQSYTVYPLSENFGGENFHSDDILSLACSEDLGWIASGSYDGEIIVIAVNSGKLIKRWHVNEPAQNDPLKDDDEQRLVDDASPKTTTRCNSSGFPVEDTKMDRGGIEGQDALNNGHSHLDADRHPLPLTSNRPSANADQAILSKKSSVNFSSNSDLYIINEARKANDMKPSTVEKVLFLDHRVSLFVKQRSENINLVMPDTFAVLVSCGSDGYVRFWNPQLGREVGKFYGVGVEGESIVSMCTDPLNVFLAIGDTDGFVRVYDIEHYLNEMIIPKDTESNDEMEQESKCNEEQQSSKSGSALGSRVSFSSLLSNSNDGTIYEDENRQPQGPKLLFKWRAHLETVVSIDLIVEHATLVTASTDGKARLWMTSGEYIGTLGQKEKWVLSDPATYQHPKLPYDIEKAMLLEMAEAESRPQTQGSCGKGTNSFILGRESRRSKSSSRSRPQSRDTEVATATSAKSRPISREIENMNAPRSRPLSRDVSIEGNDGRMSQVSAKGASRSGSSATRATSSGSVAIATPDNFQSFHVSDQKFFRSNVSLNNVEVLPSIKDADESPDDPDTNQDGSSSKRDHTSQSEAKNLARKSVKKKYYRIGEDMYIARRVINSRHGKVRPTMLPDHVNFDNPLLDGFEKTKMKKARAQKRWGQAKKLTNFERFVMKKNKEQEVVDALASLQKENQVLECAHTKSSDKPYHPKINFSFGAQIYDSLRQFDLGYVEMPSYPRALLANKKRAIQKERAAKNRAAAGSANESSEPVLGIDESDDEYSGKTDKRPKRRSTLKKPGDATIGPKVLSTKYNEKNLFPNIKVING